MKALHKDPSRRYSSAAALRDDLHRFRSGLPVLARPDSAPYRLRKFVRRNRTGVVAAATLVAVLVAATVRERTLRSRAEAETRKARAVQEYVVSVFDVADPFAWPEQRGEDVTARTLLDRGARRVDSALVTQPEVQAEMRGVLGRVYSKLGLLRDAVPHLERSLQQRRSLFGQALMAQGHTADAISALERALEMSQERFGPDHWRTAEARLVLGQCLASAGQRARAESLLREASVVLEKHRKRSRGWPERRRRRSPRNTSSHASRKTGRS